METITLISRKSTLGWQRLWKKVKSNNFLTPAFSLLFIALASIHDTYLVVIEEEILTLEKNPICAFLIQLEPAGCTLFILGKLLGGLAVISTLAMLHYARYTHATLITNAMVAFQALLVMYLHLSDPHLGGLPNFMLLFQ